MEGYSIDAQKEKLLAYCSFAVDEHGETAYTIYKFYVDDGFSGRNSRRPGYKQMMDEIGDWDVLIVLKMDRIHRNTRNFMNMMETLSCRRREFVSATEDLDTTTAIGRFVMSMIQNIAQLESEQIGERTYMGMREKASTMENTPQESRTMGFNPPYGYEIRDGLLTAVRGEMDVVKRIFDSYIQGGSMDSIAEDLNRDGIRTHQKKRFTKFSIGNILHNPVYTGYIRWQDLAYRHFAATPVDAATFNCVQRKMAGKVKDPAKRSVNLVPEADFNV